MPEWIRLSDNACFNMDHVIGIRRSEDGTAAVIVSMKPTDVVTETHLPYDELVLAIEQRERNR
jgi:hypothetical protein